MTAYVVVLLTASQCPESGPPSRCVMDVIGPYPPRDYDGLVEWMREFASRDARAALGFEGIVWHHPDGRMVKLKAKDLRELTRHIATTPGDSDG